MSATLHAWAAAGAGDATRRHGGWAAWKQSYPELFRVWQKKWGIE